MSNPNWFTTDYDYPGYAEAVFEEPRFILYGPASVRPGPNGCPIVEITVERSVPALETEFDLCELNFGSKPSAGGRKVVAVGGDRQNTVRATVRGEIGVFQNESEWNYDFPSNLEPFILRIEPTKSQFDVITSTPGALLVVPLSSFAAGFPKRAVANAVHILNSDVEADSAPRGCIGFEVAGQKASIQQLSGDADTIHGVTAVAVLPLVDAGMADPWDWFLTTFLRLLAFATGTESSAPWIETRDENSGLIRRLHFAAGNLPHMTDGYGVIDKASHCSLGEFLTTALSSPLVKKPFFSITLRHCIRAGMPGLTLDDQLDHLVRALECLCDEYDFKTQNLTDGFDSALKDNIGVVLNQAASELIKLANTAAEPVRPQVSRIADRAKSAAETDRSFGLAVESLARHFGLLDANVLAPYYANHPGPGGPDWISKLSYFRGAVLHEGFLDVDSPKTRVGDVLGFILHLHDFVVRVLLKIIGYSGTYQPRLIRAKANMDADWFKPGVKVDALLEVPTLGFK